MRTYADKRRPQLSTEDLLHLRWLLGGVLALLSVWTLFYLEPAIWPFGLLATLVILVALAFPALPGRVPRAVWLAGLPAIAIFFAVDLYARDMIPAFVRLMVVLVLYRAVAHRTRREDLQLVVLCLFLIVVTGVLTVSIAFSLQIVAFTAFAMAFLFVVNLVRDAQNEEDALPSAEWTLISRKRLLKRLWGILDLRMVLLVGSLLAIVLAISTAIFLAMPRFQMDGSLSLFQFTRGSSHSGFSESIALGEVTDIAQDHSVVMRVDAPAAAMQPGVPYWRMVVLDEYGGGSFRVSRAIQARVGARAISAREFAPDWWTGPAGEAPETTTDESGASVTVFLEGGVSRYLPLPGQFSRVRFKDMENIVPNPIFGVISTPQLSAGLLSFQIEGGDFSGSIPDPDFERTLLRAPAGARFDSSTVDDRFRHRFLSYPATTAALPIEEEERALLRELVDRITGGARLDPRTFAQRACAFLAETHDYALSVSLADSVQGQDPVVRWLRAGLPGHCEFFAASFTLLCRTAGFPTRAITGFRGGTWNSFEHYFMVRNSDAHAWCEVYDGAGSWFRVDPTPGAVPVGQAPGVGPSLAAIAADRSMSAYFDSLRMIWYRRIVSFDKRSQREVAGLLKNASGKAAAEAGSVMGRLAREVVAWMHQPWTLESRGDLFYLGVIGILAFCTARRTGLRVSDLWGRMARGEAAARRKAGLLLRRLQVRLAEPKPDQRWDASSARELEAQLILIRYGRIESWPEPLRVFRTVRRLL